MQMGVGIRQSVADVDTDSLLSQNWPPSPPVRWRSCSETDSATTEKHGRKKTEKTARNATEFLISVDLGKVWPPELQTRAGNGGKRLGEQLSPSRVSSIPAPIGPRGQPTSPIFESGQRPMAPTGMGGERWQAAEGTPLCLWERSGDRKSSRLK